jgi:tripartite-type tricarboxylate transporter receptor subunit TctC
MTKTMFARLPALLAIALLASAGAASAQTYPGKPIRIVVGFAPGGPADVMARLIGQRMTAMLGQSIVVDNRPGAGGTIGARATAESEPDGYTLLLGNTSTLIIGPLIYRSAGYDPAKSFAPVALLGTTSNLLIVHPALPVRSVQELIALAKAQPGKLNYASAGIGTPPHLIGEMFKQRLGLDVVHVPYKGGGPSLQAVVAGEAQLSFENPASSLPQVQAGNVRALAVTSASRSPQTPELPTMIEAGVADFNVTTWIAVFARAGSPRPVIERLHGEFAAILALPAVKERLATLGYDVAAEGPDALAALMKHDTARWAEVIRKAGIAQIE